MSEPITLTFDKLAPGVNAAYGNRRQGQMSRANPGKKARGRYITPELTAWREAAGKALLAQLVGRKRPVFAGPVTIEILAPRPVEVFRKDGDGPVKPTLDLLVSMQVIADDSHQWVRSHTMTWIEPEDWDGAHGCEVRVTPILGCRAEQASAGSAAASQENPLRGEGRGDMAVTELPAAFKTPSEKSKKSQNRASARNAAVQRWGKHPAPKASTMAALKKLGVRVAPERVHEQGGRP